MTIKWQCCIQFTHEWYHLWVNKMPFQIKGKSHFFGNIQLPCFVGTGHILSDSNTIILTWIRRYKQKRHTSKISVDSNIYKLCIIMWCFIAPKTTVLNQFIIDDNFCMNCSHFILKWFHPKSFGEMCFSEESYKQIQKIQILKIWERPQYKIREYALNIVLFTCSKYLKQVHFDVKIPAKYICVL